MSLVHLRPYNRSVRVLASDCLTTGFLGELYDVVILSSVPRCPPEVDPSIHLSRVGDGWSIVRNIVALSLMVSAGLLVAYFLGALALLAVTVSAMLFLPVAESILSRNKRGPLVYVYSNSGETVLDAYPTVECIGRICNVYYPPDERPVHAITVDEVHAYLPERVAETIRHIVNNQY